MFSPIDFDQVAARAERITPKFVERVFDRYVRAGLLDRAAYDEICKEIRPLLELIQGPLQGEPFWVEFQKQFGFAATVGANRVTPMNAANLCPEPTALIRAANVLRVAYNDNVAQQTRTSGGLRVRQIQGVRKRLAESLGIGNPNNLALLRNSSEGNNIISCGYREWKKGDTVVVWRHNHPTNLEAWRLRRDWHSGRRAPDDNPRSEDPFRLIVVDFHKDTPDDQILAAFTSKIDGSTRFVSYSETANSGGFRLPESVIAGIWRHVTANKLDCHVHVDGTMTWGARPVNLARQPYCHSFVSSAHKWFLGPKETAVFYMDPDRARKFAPSIFAYDYKIHSENWDKMLVNSALRFELLGQRDDVNLITLYGTALMWTALGPRKPHERVRYLGELLFQQLRESGWVFDTPDSPDRRWGIVRVKARAKDEKNSLYSWLFSQGPRIAGSGGSGAAHEQEFRLCPHIYNTERDIEAAVAGMNEWRKRFGAG
jgi:selenocysteine lyase/cysteine desulfurase